MREPLGLAGWRRPASGFRVSSGNHTREAPLWLWLQASNHPRFRKLTTKMCKTALAKLTACLGKQQDNYDREQHSNTSMTAAEILVH
eukprot:366000-Chlamydomonas_euryale.AAC.12